jgi:outer membrane lipoprotein-sorting protein
MSVFRSRPALRWLVPAAAAVLVVGGGAAGGLVANADPTLPERSAAQLLADLQTAHVDGLSGTVVQRADLGLPALPNMGGGGSNEADLTRLASGTNTLRVWYAGPEKSRLALLSTLGETDLIRNGDDVWVWRSQDKTASHLKVPAGQADATPRALPSGLPSTPQAAADAALAAIDPTTKVSTSGAANVAGRDAYELVLAPKDTASKIGQVRLAIDAEHKIPLRVEVFAAGSDTPAFRVAFEQVDFGTPDAEQFRFNPPPGSKITETTPEQLAEKAPSGDRPTDRPAEGDRPTVVGTGWTSVVVAKLPNPDAAQPAEGSGQLQAVLDRLPKVSGTWGSGRLLTGTLFSALLTDDGRVLVGAVAPEKLYEAAGK